MFQDIFISDFFLVLGIITGITGFLFALSQSDMKLILAYSTVSQVGMIMIGLNIQDIYSHTGGVYHIFNHALFKSALFLCAGSIIKMYGTRDIHQIRGVLQRLPVVGSAMILAILGITGAPLFNGSISKYFIMSGANRLVSNLMLFLNLGTILVFIRFATILFGSPATEGGVAMGAVSSGASIDAFQQAAVLLLGVMCFTGGVFGEQLIKLLFSVEVSVDHAGYLEKTAIYGISAALGYLIYKYYVKTSRFFQHIREVELSFQWMCISIGAFFAVMLLAVRMWTA